MTLRTIPADAMIREAISLLPKHPPGTGASITLPAPVLDAAAAQAGTDPDKLARALERQGLGPPEAHKIADIAAAVIRYGHFGLARTRTFDKRHRAGNVVSVYDTHQHRYLFTRKPGSSGAWVTLRPGTKAAITHQIGELFTEVDRPVGVPP